MPPAEKKLDVALNLDTLEREDKKPEYPVVLGGRRMVLIDPADLDWKVLQEFDSPDDFVDMAFEKEDGEFVRTLTIPGWKFKVLWEDYQKHFGIGEPGKDNGSST